MKYIITAALVLLLVSSAYAGDLVALDLEDSSKLGLTIQSDTQDKTQGKASIKVKTLWPTTICLGEVMGPDIENAKLVYSANVKTDLEGAAYLEMWAHVQGRTYFSRGMNDQVKGKSEWKIVKTPFIFQKGQKPEKVTLNLVINGRGTVWIDDVKLSRVPD